MKSMLVAALLAGAASAQLPVCTSGVVQPVGGPTICMQGETHQLQGTRVYLRSATVDLTRLVGQLVRIEGTDVGLVCNVIDVTAATPAVAVLDHCGTPMPGCSIKLRVGPGALGRYALFAAFTPAFAPFGCAPPGFGIDGALLLQSPSLLALGLFPGPYGELVLAIPPSPAMQGLRVWFQGARQDIGPVGPVQLTNSLQFTIVPFMPPCGSINC